MYLTSISKNLTCVVGASFSNILFKIPLSVPPLFQTVFHEGWKYSFIVLVLKKILC